MKIPKTYHGIPIVIPDKTPKYKKNSIATADSTRDGKPIIKIWKEHKHDVTPHVLAHEEGHIKYGHHSRSGSITRGDYIRDEKKAEIFANKAIGGNGIVPSRRLANIIYNMIGETSKTKQEYIYSHWDNFRKYTVDRSSAYGFTKEEMKRAIDYIYEHSTKKIRR